jgi:hypothetical protein
MLVFERDSEMTIRTALEKVLSEYAAATTQEFKRHAVAHFLIQELPEVLRHAIQGMSATGGDEGFLINADTADPLYSGSQRGGQGSHPGLRRHRLRHLSFLSRYDGTPPCFRRYLDQRSRRLGERANKPAITEEYGLELSTAVTPDQRNQWYAS